MSNSLFSVIHCPTDKLPGKRKSIPPGGKMHIYFEAIQAKITPTLSPTHVCPLTHTHTQLDVNSCTGWQASVCVSLTKHYWRAHYIMPWYEHVIKAMPGRQEQPTPDHSAPQPHYGPPPTPNSAPPPPPCQQSREEAALQLAAYISLHEVHRGPQLPADIQLKSFFIFPFAGSAPTTLLLLSVIS